MQLKISKPQISQKYKGIATDGNIKENKDNNVMKLNENRKRNKSFFIFNKKSNLGEEEE